MIDQKLINKLSKNIEDKRLRPMTRLGYTELTTLAGMLYLKDIFSFKEITQYNQTAIEILKLRASLNLG